MEEDMYTKRIVAAFLVAVMGGVELVSAQAFGEWAVDIKDPNVFFAVTLNDSDHLIGQYCYTSEHSCVWLLAMSTRCKKGDTYPVLANSDAGAASLQLLCDGQLENGHYRYVFTGFDDVDKLVRDSKTRIGFAFPMEGDEFRVVRFDLRGAEKALTTMR